MKKKIGRPSVPDPELKKVRSVRVSDQDLEKIDLQFGSIQRMVDTVLVTLAEKLKTKKK